MEWTFDWLKDYLKTDATAAEIADKLTLIGLEVEKLVAPIVPIAAKIVECSDIPDTHLHLLKVDDGTEIRQVVCGAPNVRVGLVGALARPGCQIAGTEIKVGKIRGFESNGMMCSEKELGLGNNHEGIIELQNAKIGEPVAKVGDFVFEAGITPNRPDYLSVRGIARDLAATGIGKFKEPAVKRQSPAEGSRKAVIKNKERCPVYNFAEIRGIKIAPSNAKIASRLAAVGINPKNAPVDATNYVCLDMGQPLHCFDADEIRGDIIIRNAEDGERFTDLFGAEHSLVADDLVITDADGILALAGVVGGKRGMTTDATKNIILESAYFEPLGIRKTRRRLNVSTDASYRYERGVDPMITGDGLSRAAGIVMKECGGKIVALDDSRPDIANAVVKYDPKNFIKKTGIRLSAARQKKILENLGYKIDAEWNASVPFWRAAEAIPETLIADVIRIYGYDKIGCSAGDGGCSKIFEPRLSDDVRDNEFFAFKRRLTEHVSMGFGNIYSEKLVGGNPSVKIANPMTDFMNTARNSLIPNMLDAVAENTRRGYPDLAMFEIGTVFDGPNPGDEHRQIVIARAGQAGPRHWLKRGRQVDIFDVKADLLAYFGVDAKTETDNPPIWAHPFKYGRIVADGRLLGEFGELHPKLARRWRIKAPVMIGLIDNPVRNSKSIARDYGSDFQPIERDFSFALEKEIPAGAVVAAARAADPRIADVAEFDFYENSIAFTTTISPDRNMSDKDILEIQNKVIAAVEKLGAKVRDK
jgi:phenylalanyl-tRNA synthetase beta chain